MIELLRDKHGLSVQDLAKALKVSRQTIYNAEHGQMSKSLLIAIADYFDVSTDYILGRTSQQTNKENKPLSCPSDIEQIIPSEKKDHLTS